MAESDKENLWQATKSDIPEPPAPSPGVAPPPQEVKVRTLRSDIESMTKSGGGLPKFKSVKLNFSAKREGGSEQNKKNKGFWIVAILVAIGAIIAASFLAYQAFSGRTQTETEKSGLQGEQPSQATADQAQQQSPEFIHSSLFKKKPADQILDFVVGSSIENAADLQTYTQKLNGVLSGTDASTNFLEIRVSDIDGKDLAVDEILTLADALVLPRDFLLSHFNPDTTFFIYRNEDGFWPGYVLELKPSENWLFLNEEIAQLEKSARLENFFLVSPGKRISNGFNDAEVDSQPVRSLSFDSASLYYGWFRGRLILSASENGLKEALLRL